MLPLLLIVINAELLLKINYPVNSYFCQEVLVPQPGYEKSIGKIIFQRNLLSPKCFLLLRRLKRPHLYWFLRNINVK